MKTAPTEKIPPAEVVRRLLTGSEFLQGLAAARAWREQKATRRALTTDEIRILHAQNSAADDWTHVLVAQDFNPHKVIGCYFSGDAQLGSFNEKVTLEPGVRIGSGLYNCTLHDVSVADNALVANTDLVAHYHIGPGAIVYGCGTLVCSGETVFGNGQRISLGLEASGRETSFFAELTSDMAAQVAGGRGDGRMLEEYEAAVREYLQAAASDFGVIGPGACVKQTSRMVNTYVGPGARVTGATWVENTTILSNPHEPAHVNGGASVKNSLLQWGARVEQQAVVESSICCEYSAVEEHGQLRQSLLGSNSSVGSGECIHSLVGPFVGFHHQALLIAAFWPEGKGNVGYGANVGSNHTGKAPDQEIWPGEGVFFGLGVNVKFPTDFSKAPYTLVAAGVSTLPQKCQMPFSLINVRAEHIAVPPGYNEILPGWQLSDNIYAIRRNEQKYATRDRAKRSSGGHEIFRPAIVDLLVGARTTLQNAGDALRAAHGTPRSADHARDAAGLVVYTDKDIPALGKNFM